MAEDVNEDMDVDVNEDGDDVRDGRDEDDEDDEVCVLDGQLVTHDNEEADDKACTCPVCQDELEPAGYCIHPRNERDASVQPWGVTPCGHTYHYACLHAWRQEVMRKADEASQPAQFLCPVCRHSLPKSMQRMMRNDG